MRKQRQCLVFLISILFMAGCGSSVIQSSQLQNTEARTEINSDLIRCQHLILTSAPQSKPLFDKNWPQFAVLSYKNFHGVDPYIATLAINQRIQILQKIFGPNYAIILAKMTRDHILNHSLHGKLRVWVVTDAILNELKNKPEWKRHRNKDEAVEATLTFLSHGVLGNWWSSSANTPFCVDEAAYVWFRKLETN